MSAFSSNFKLGILGGGQLGRMLIQAAIDFNIYIKILDADPHAPSKPFAHEFVLGSLMDFETVYAFGKNVNVLTIEIEHVNVEALEKLQSEGVKVYPQPQVIRTIQDKRVQKQFYRQHGIPTSDFVLVDDKAALAEHHHFLPAFQKLGKSGYDGRGVQRLSSASDLHKAFTEPSVLEKARYDGMEEALAIEGVYVHLYGKKITKPFRKMGHITILDNNLEVLQTKVEQIKNRVKVIT